MKRNLLKILPFLLLGGVLGLAVAPAAFETAGVNAEDPNIVEVSASVFDGQGDSPSGKKCSYTTNGITISTTNGYGTGGRLRVYSGKSLKIESSDYNISKVELTLPDSDYRGLDTVYDNVDSKTFSKATSKQTRISNFKITLSTGDVVLSSLSLDTSNAKTTFTKGQTLDLTGLKVNGNKVGGGTVDVTSQCTFSPAEGTKLDEVGSTEVNITYAGTNTPATESGEDITASYSVTVTEGEAKAIYKKVTSNTLKAGDKIIFVSDSASAAATKGLYNDKYLGAATIEINDDTASFADSDNVEVFTVVNGKNSGTYAFKNSNDKYLSVKEQGNDILKFDTNITDAASWTVDLTATANNIVSGIGGTNCYLKYNSNTFRAYKSTSLVPPAYIYKYSSGNERVVLDYPSKDVYENYSTTITAEAVEFEPTLWSWESSNPAYVSVLSGGDSATVTVKGIAPGSSNLTVTANGKYKATCVVTCKSAGSLVIEPGDYFITDLSNKYMMGSDLSNVDDVDISQSGNLYTFEFAGLGDGTYWVSNKEGKYLAFRQNVIPDGKRMSEMTFTDEKVDYWTVTKNASNQYKVATDYNGKSKSIAQDGDHDWLAFDGDNFVNLTKQGTLKEFRIGHEPQYKKYYVGEDFKTTGLVVYAVFDVDGSEFLSDVTSKVVWDELVAGTKATGTYSSGDDAYVVTVNGLSILGPVAGSMVVAGLKDTYLIGEMPKETISEIKVTYSDGSNEEIKTLKEDEYIVSPDKINSATTKVVVSMVDFPEVKYEKNITAEHAKYFATNMIEIGDKVTLGTTVGAADGNITGGSEIAMVDGALKSQEFGYLPTPAMEFTVRQGINSGTYAFEYNGSYLRTNGKTLDLGDVSTQTATKFSDLYEFDLPYSIGGNNVMVHFTEDEEGAETFWGYYYDYTTYNLIQAEAIIADNTLSVEYTFYPNGLEPAVVTEQDYVCEFNGTWVIYLPISQEITAANSFTCNYIESQNDWVDDYWEICPVSESTSHVFFNEASGKFGVSSSGDYNAMLYRDMTKDFTHEIKSLSVSIPEDMPTTVSLGEPYNWVGITVKAKYDNTTKKLPLGAYEVDIPSTDTYGEKTCTVTYGTSNNKVSATFKITVVGGYQPFIKQNTYEVWVDDTNTFTTTQEPPVGEPVTWSSSNPEIANFEDPHVGDLTAYKSGKVTIKVTSYDGYYSDTSELTVSQRPTGLTLSETEKTIKQGEKFILTGTVSPTDAKNKTVLWSSSNEDIATVNSKGEVTGLGIGDAIITGQTQGKGTGEEEGYKATCTVHVEEGEVVRVTGVSLSSTTKEIEVGASATLTAIIAPSNASEQGVTWTSKYPEIVTVDKNGKVTGKKKGSSDVTVTTLDGGFTATCRVTVKDNVEPVPVSSISLDITNKKIDINEEFILTATISPIDADNKSIQWTSNDTSVATVAYYAQGKAKVVGVANGTATITATTNNGKTATCIVTVGDEPVPPTPVVVESVSLDKTSLVLGVNEASKLIATINPSDATNKNVTWSSNDTSVATVDANGNVKGIAAGTATITVTTADGGKIATCAVTVTSAPSPIHVESVSLDSSQLTLDIGDDHTLVATVTPSNATIQAVTWKSSNINIVTVDSNGKVTAVAEGEAVIFVTTVDGSLTATCHVIVNQASEEKKSDNNAAIVAGVGGTVAVAGVGCGVGIPLGLKAKKRKLHK